MTESQVRRIAAEEAEKAGSSAFIMSIVFTAIAWSFSLYLLSRPGVLEKLAAGQWTNLL